MKQFVSNFHGHACTLRAHRGFGSFQSVNLKGWTLPSRAELASIRANGACSKRTPTPLPEAPSSSRLLLWLWCSESLKRLFVSLTFCWLNAWSLEKAPYSSRWVTGEIILLQGKTAFLAHFVKSASKNTEQMWAQLHHFNWHLDSLHLEKKLQYNFWAISVQFSTAALYYIMFWPRKAQIKIWFINHTF